MNYTSFICLFCLTSQITIAQFKPVECTTVQDKSKVYIKAENKSPGTYTVKFQYPIFSGLEPIPDPKQLFAVPAGIHTIQEFTIPKGIQPDLQYSFRLFEGKIFTDKPSTTIFLLPAHANDTLKHLESYFIAERPGQQPPADYKSYYFQCKPGNEICAAKGGIITKINDEIAPHLNTSKKLTGNRNVIRIEHEDGTLASYTFIHPVEIKISIGDKIKAGEALAITPNTVERTGVFISHYFLDILKVTANTKSGGTNYIYSYLPIEFYIESGEPLLVNKNYKTVHPKKMIK